jgi:hypothetical protein
MMLGDTVVMLLSRLAHDGLCPCRRLYSAPGRALEALSSLTYHLHRDLAQPRGLVAFDLKCKLEASIVYLELDEHLWYTLNRIAEREDHEESEGFLMKEIATLVRHKIPLTLRGDVPASAFPRQYKAESLDISLHLSHSGSGSSLLLGILTSTSASERIDAFEGMNADLFIAPGPFATEGDKQTEKPFLRTQIDDIGHFVLRDVPGGEYVLVLHLPEREVIIEELTMWT